jgi:hypothetical protein
MNLHAGNNDPRRTVEYAEKAIKSDPESISTLIQVSRMYASLQTQMEKAVQYGEKAATLRESSRSSPFPAGTNASAWQDVGCLDELQRAKQSGVGETNGRLAAQVAVFARGSGSEEVRIQKSAPDFFVSPLSTRDQRLDPR